MTDLITGRRSKRGNSLNANPKQTLKKHWRVEGEDRTSDTYYIIYLILLPITNNPLQQLCDISIMRNGDMVRLSNLLAEWLVWSRNQFEPRCSKPRLSWAPKLPLCLPPWLTCKGVILKGESQLIQIQATRNKSQAFKMA